MAWNPIANTVPQYEDANGNPYSGSVLKAYAAGTSTNISLATDTTGGTTATSIALNANGYPEVSGNIVIPHVDQDYKLALYPTQAAADSDTGAIWTIDNIETTAAASNEWQTSNLTPTRTSDTTFTLSGDQTAEFHINRRLRLTDSGGTDYGTISASSFSTPNTTVTVALDEGGALDSGLSAVDLSILSGNNSAVPSLYQVFADEDSIGTDTITLSVTPSLSLTKGLQITFKAGGTNTGATTLNPNGLGATTVTFPDGTALTAGSITTGQMYTVAYDGTNFILLTSNVGRNGLIVAGDIATGAVGNDAVAAGAVVQVVNTQTGAVSTGTTTIPLDDTIPQNTEGDEVMTLSITPKSTTNKLKIEVTGYFANSSAAPTQTSMALFQDATVDALAAAWGGRNSGTNDEGGVTLVHYMTAGTTSATTFKVRAGATAGTLTFNGRAGARIYGGVMASSITITEIKSN